MHLLVYLSVHNISRTKQQVHVTLAEPTNAKLQNSVELMDKLVQKYLGLHFLHAFAKAIFFLSFFIATCALPRTT